MFANDGSKMTTNQNCADGVWVISKVSFHTLTMNELKCNCAC